jgi:hypothetical protein
MSLTANQNLRIIVTRLELHPDQRPGESVLMDCISVND